jgi:hypothetical protein
MIDPLEVPKSRELERIFFGGATPSSGDITRAQDCQALMPDGVYVTEVDVSGRSRKWVWCAKRIRTLN